MTHQNSVIHFDAKRASDAYEVHQALVWLESRHPELKRNPRWCLLRTGAYADFAEAYTPEGK